MQSFPTSSLEGRPRYNWRENQGPVETHTYCDGNGGKCLGQRLWIRRDYLKFDDTALTGIDVGFTQHVGAIIHDGLKLNVGRSGGQDVAACGQNL